MGNGTERAIKHGMIEDIMPDAKESLGNFFRIENRQESRLISFSCVPGMKLYIFHAQEQLSIRICHIL